MENSKDNQKRFALGPVKINGVFSKETKVLDVDPGSAKPQPRKSHLLDAAGYALAAAKLLPEN